MSLHTKCQESNVKYLLVSFVDLFGVVRSKLVPASMAQRTEEGGAGFAGFAAHLDMTPADPDIFVMPDSDTLTVLPWNPEVAWVTGDLMMNGKAVLQNPRNVLKRVFKQACEQGYLMKSGVEAEFFLLNSEGTALSDLGDTQHKPCYDQQALMRRYEVIKEICDAMQTLGWNPYQNDHEDANGQFEMNWDYSDALTTADRHVFFKFMVKSIAEKHGFRATFMPKPFQHLTGNGCHAHVSLWDPNGSTNLFHDSSDEMGLSQKAYSFMGGVMKHAKALTALTNPSVNSFKRLHAGTTHSGATWAPNTITYSGNNRTHMIRIPDEGRFELRLADGATNPYLLQAGVLGAGLSGVLTSADPGQRLDINMITEKPEEKCQLLPQSLEEALDGFSQNSVFAETLGAEFVESYVKLRSQQYKEYLGIVTEWERTQTLDC